MTNLFVDEGSRRQGLSSHCAVVTRPQLRLHCATHSKQLAVSRTKRSEQVRDSPALSSVIVVCWPFVELHCQMYIGDVKVKPLKLSIVIKRGTQTLASDDSGKRQTEKKVLSDQQGTNQRPD